jgi:hypothetical protein
MTILSRIERLESASVFTGPVVREVTEAEFDDLSIEDKSRYLRNQLPLRVISQDDGPTFDEACAAAGVVRVEMRPGESDADASRRISDAELKVYHDWMEASAARYEARRAARKAAKAAAEVSRPATPVAPAAETTPTPLPTPPDPPPPEQAAATDFQYVPPQPQAPPPGPPPPRRPANHGYLAYKFHD